MNTLLPIAQYYGAFLIMRRWQLVCIHTGRLIMEDNPEQLETYARVHGIAFIVIDR
jgi:hypothetical protein